RAGRSKRREASRKHMTRTGTDMDENQMVDGLRTRFVQVEQRERSVAARERVSKVAEQNIHARFDSVLAREEAARKLEIRLQAWAVTLMQQTENNINYATKFFDSK